MSGPFGASQFMYASGGFYPFEISNSLRLDSASETLLEKTNAASGGSAATIATLSCWFKYNVQDVESSQMPLIWNDSDASGIAFAQSSNTPHHIYVYWGGQGALTTAAVFRDPSAWYHIVAEIDSTQGTEANRLKLYINGVQVDWSGSFSQNTSSAFFNNNVKQRIGEDANNRHFSGYATDINAIEGTAYAASYFGEFKNDIWVPKNPSVTYGTNGFRLQFKNSGVGTASASTIGADTSGNTNHFTSTNIAANDQVPDNPTNNFCTINTVDQVGSNTVSEGNLKTIGGSDTETRGTISLGNGKWYWEVRSENYTANMFGISEAGETGVNYFSANNGIAYYGVNGYKYVQASGASYGASYGNGDIIGHAYDGTNNTLTYYKNNSSQGAITVPDVEYVPSIGGAGSHGGIFNFGQDSSFAGAATAQNNADENGIGDFYYSPPSGFLSLCTANLPDPVATIDPAQGGSPQDYFNSTLYTGTGSLLAVTTGFQPDWTWIKSRTTTDQHIVQDSVRGNFILYPDSTQAEGATGGGWVTETSTGFTADANGPINTSGDTYVAWNWKAGTAFSNDASATSVGSIDSSGSVNTDIRFSIVKADSVPASTTSTIAHGLGVKPDVILLKSRNNSTNWEMYHSSLTPDGERKLYLNSNGAEIDSGFMNDTPPTSTVFSFNPGGSDSNHIAYCFAEVDGYSKFGTYVGNENADGTFVYTGFRPAFILIKKVAAGDWGIYDSKRDGFNESNAVLYPSEAIAEENQASRRIDLLSNGFKLRTSNVTFNDDSTSIFMAFAEQPFKYANAR